MEAETVKEDTLKEEVENASAQVAAAVAPTAKPQESTKRPRREERNRKDDRSYDLFLKAVNSAPPAEQINIATQKYLAMLDENKKMQFYIKQSDKRHALILKEKEQLQLEFNKTILLKSKLENLCRELQKQNKSIKDESLHKIREEEERRKETQAKFQTTLAEISALLQQNNEKNSKLRDDNISMTEKFKTVVQQYQMREDQVDKMSKQMELESQLNAAKMQKASLEHQAERERLSVEIETLRMAVAEYRAKVNEMQGTETGLRGQLAVYTDKYDEFQSALMKSNQVFGGFKDQMEKMSKKIKTLEKESVSWKQRWESSQSALLDMCGERQAADVRLVAVQRQLQHMQSLCRTLQAERTVLLGTLKEHDIERPPLPAPAPAPVEPLPLPSPHSAASDAKVDAMAVNCAQLRQSLAHLQSQLNVLTTQQTQVDETQPEKPKKNKNKKKSKKAVAEEPKVTEVNTVEEKETDNVNETVEENKEASQETIEAKTAEPESVDKEATQTIEAKTAEPESVDKVATQTIEAKTAEPESVDKVATQTIEAKTAEPESVDKVATQTIEAKTAEPESVNKEVTQTIEAKAEPESVDLAVEKVDEKVLESLMKAINIANVDLSDLEVDNNMSIQEVLDAKVTDSEITSSNKENGIKPIKTEVPESPKSSPKKNSPKTSPKSKDSPKKVTIIEPEVKETETVSNTAEVQITSDQEKVNV